MRHDCFGLPLTLTGSGPAQDWDAAVMAFLAHGAATPVHLGRVLEAEPEFAMGQAVKGLFLLLLGRRELVEGAHTALAAARVGLERVGGTARERRYVAALDRWLTANAPGAAVAALEEILRAAPEDALAMKLSHAIRFVLGDGPGMLRSVARVLPACGPDHVARGYVLGCHAFALEEAGAYRRAEIAGRQALWLAPDDAWGLHAVAHVHDMTGNARAGLDWLTGHEAAWTHCNNFRFHVWWHKALMHLDLGEADAVLALYDTRVRAEHTDDYRDIANAASLLMRLELEGVDVGARWEELAELSARRTGDGCLVFADLHYLMALGAAGDPAGSAALIARLARDAAGPRDEMSARVADPGLAAAEGLRAFCQGDYATAHRRLAQARPSLQQAGGSHAQRDVFERMAIDAALRAGHLSGAETLLNDRQSRRGGHADGYGSARRALIAAARADLTGHSVPAQ